MSVKRIIPCLDTRNGRVVKGVNFESVREIASPVELAEFYNGGGADELVLYDITASIEGRMIFADVLRSVAQRVSIPFTVGGGISNIADVEMVLANGADKVSINSGAIRDPSLIGEAVKKYGSQRIVMAMDCKRADGKFRVFTSGGKHDTGIDMLEWARCGEADGAGELVINSIDTDGVRQGFDLEMLEAVTGAVSIPIVASGGAGKKEDFLELFTKLPVVGAGLAASIFHSKQLLIADLKTYLAENGIGEV